MNSPFVSAFVWPIPAAGGVAAGIYAARGDAKGHRGRLRDLGWSVALLILAFRMLSMFPQAENSDLLRVVWIPLAIGLLAAWRPALAARVLPVMLIIYGLFGLSVAHDTLLCDPGQAYGLARAGACGPGTEYVLPEAYLILAVGGWLGWRELRGHPAAAWLVLGHMTDPKRRSDRLGLLMLPVALAVGALVQSSAWFVVTIVLLAASMLVIRAAPGVAARLAAAALVALGILGLLATHNWYIENVEGHGGAAALYGPVAVLSRGMRAASWVEAFALIGLGCWLVPRAFPAVGGLLGRAPDAQLVKRVQRLAESRAVAVDTAASDLRRLERDLHDGAQARLVALGMNLRAAEKLIHTSPDAAAALVAEAREASARALTELRELVRGVHPPVLADRGLADAVRALALDSPLHVTTDVDLPGRVPAPVETACYFSIAELLTNAAKHSSGREARVAIRHEAEVLRIEVTDFGLGGADPARGTGLTGIERRLAAFDGILAVSSPVGGPTIAVMEVPCVLSSPKICSS
jgi:signal transduction histidine kinase